MRVFLQTNDPYIFRNNKRVSFVIWQLWLVNVSFVRFDKKSLTHLAVPNECIFFLFVANKKKKEKQKTNTNKLGTNFLPTTKFCKQNTTSNWFPYLCRLRLNSTVFHQKKIFDHSCECIGNER